MNVNLIIEQVILLQGFFFAFLNPDVITVHNGQLC